jgi:DNA polymerase-1
LKFNVQATYFTKLWHKAKLPEINLTEFVWNLSVDALRSWTDAWLMAEGTQGKYLVSQNFGPKLDALELSLILTGHSTDIQRIHQDGKCALVHYTKSRWLTPQKTRITDAGQDDVWCPTTKLGTWLARDADRNTFLTGNSMDCVLTARLAQVLRPRLVATNSVRAYELELAASWVCERMERNGIMVDRPYASEALERFQTHAKAISDWCAEYYGVRPSQNASVAARLMADGVVLDKATATGAVQMDKEVLGGIDHPLAQAVLDHRRYSKLASTYLRNFMSGTSEEDPRLHPRINTVGAVTSRMSMSDPNLQNLPRRSEENVAAITVRNALTASEGHTLLMIDYDQIELRFLAHIANDPGLREAFLDEDVFTSIARELFADPSLTKKDARRGHTKNAMYSIGYGAGAPKFAKTAGLTEEHGQAMYAMIAQRYPLMKGLNRMIERRADERFRIEGSAYAKSPLTGRRHPMDGDKRYTLVNKLVQGTAAELLKMKLVELDLAGFGEYLVLPVHDEIVFDAPNELLPEVARDACKIMADDDLISVPITVAPSTGFRWGEKMDYVL